MKKPNMPISVKEKKIEIDVNKKCSKVIFGSWPEKDIRRVFVDGAKWWEYYKTKFTMWNSDVREAELEAERRYPEGKIKENNYFCKKCGCHWATHNDDGSCVEDHD